MDVEVKPGKYVVAVSGGVDSVALLHALQALPELELTVAHFDHGIRADSREDAQLVAQLARRYQLPFVTERAELGAAASENTARQARYAFLRRVRFARSAQAIITAHHQDDVLETVIFNLRRGTGRRGLTSLQTTPELLRPLLGIPKQAITTFAVQHALSWREDTTNYDQRYARNQIRQQLLAQADYHARQQLLMIIERFRAVNAQLDSGLAELLAAHSSAAGVERRWFAALPSELAREVLATWLRAQGISDFTRQTLLRLAAGAKTSRTGSYYDVLHGYQLVVQKDYLALRQQER